MHGVTSNNRANAYSSARRNDAVYLKDQTGGRRFWPVKVGIIDLDSLAFDREQLFAEAVARYKRKEKWWPDQGFEKDVIKPEQDARTVSDSWVPLIADHLRTCSKTYVHQVAKSALGIEPSKIDKMAENRIMPIMEGLGWCRGKRDKNGSPWYPPASLL